MSISTAFIKTSDYVANSGLMKKLNLKSKTSKDAIDYITLGSVVGNDAVGCAFYVYQSLNNEEIPEDKRKYVAAVDLVQGIGNVVLQVASFFAFKKTLTPRILNWLKKSTFSEKLITKIKNKFPENSNLIAKAINSDKKLLEEGFGSMFTLVVTTLLMKRMLNPFITTPAAGWVEKNVLSDDKDEKQPLNIKA